MIGTLTRLRDILHAAPWSNHDLLAALIVVGMGGLLLGQPGLFHGLGGLYGTLESLSSEWQWGSLFLLCGGFSLLVTLWCHRPSFLVRLISRLSITFCFLSVTFNHLTLSPIPMATAAYLGLALWSLWGAIRTHSSGR